MKDPFLTRFAAVLNQNSSTDLRWLASPAQILSIIVSTKILTVFLLFPQVSNLNLLHCASSQRASKKCDLIAATCPSHNPIAC